MRSAESFPGDGEEGRGGVKEPQPLSRLWLWLWQAAGKCPCGLLNLLAGVGLETRRLLPEGQQPLPVQPEELGDTFTL